jgi:hypothetical protein
LPLAACLVFLAFGGGRTGVARAMAAMPHVHVQGGPFVDHGESPHHGMSWVSQK